MTGVSAAAMENVRAYVGGKFIYLGDQKFYIRGVTYGPFHPDADGGEYHSPDCASRSACPGNSMSLLLDQACETIFTEFSRAVDAIFTPGLLGRRTMRARVLGALAGAPEQESRQRGEEPAGRLRCGHMCRHHRGESNGQDSLR